ncbi:MAG: hypothetical protein K1X94_08195 [Sandaracinaceae bacterium]|nr:hypothetical protein [Sandaracinaceae bacterium]
MRLLGPALVLALTASSTLARADAIQPFDGECPPGLEETESHHAEICQPIACTSDAQCGARAACRPIAECWAPREFSPSDGRLADDTIMRDQVIGLCRADGTCAEGHCETRRQCEPTVNTEAWDPTGRRWTGEPYRSGCSVGGRRGAPPAALALAALGLLALVRRRRAR